MRMAKVLEQSSNGLRRQIFLSSVATSSLKPNRGRDDRKSEQIWLVYLVDFIFVIPKVQ